MFLQGARTKLSLQIQSTDFSREHDNFIKPLQPSRAFTDITFPTIGLRIRARGMNTCPRFALLCCPMQTKDFKSV